MTGAIPHQTQGSSSTCTAQLYTNKASLCYPFLTQYKTCIPSLTNKSGVYIASSVNLQQSESTATKIQIFEGLLSSECQKVALPFLCLYLFPLCDDKNTAYLPSMMECISISTGICNVEWNFAASYVNLPDCSRLPNVSTACTGMLQCVCIFVIVHCIVYDRFNNTCTNNNCTNNTCSYNCTNNT